MEQDEMDTDVILYSDFNCPFCYALEERLFAVQAAHRLTWRGVQHAPHLPVPMASADATLAAELNSEIRAIAHLAPEVPVALPRGKPNTGPALRAVAAALHIDKGRAREFKRSIYREFWQHGGDISDPSVLKNLAHSAGLPEELDKPGVATTLAEWQQAWQSGGLGGVPTMMRSDGEILVGLADTEAIIGFLNKV